MSVVKDPRLRWLFIGSSSDAKNLEWLRKNNIRYIINCTDTVENGGVPNYHQSDPSLEYCRLPCSDNESELLEHHYQKGWEFFNRCLVREDGACLVHCKLGVSRSASYVMSFLIKFLRMRYMEALHLLIASRPSIYPNADFRQQLQELSSQLESNQSSYWELPFADEKESLLLSGRFVDVWAREMPKTSPHSTSPPTTSPTTTPAATTPATTTPATTTPATTPTPTKLIGPVLPPSVVQESPKQEKQEPQPSLRRSSTAVSKKVRFNDDVILGFSAEQPAM